MRVAATKPPILGSSRPIDYQVNLFGKFDGAKKPILIQRRLEPVFSNTDAYLSHYQNPEKTFQ